MTDTNHTSEPWYPSLESDGWRVMALDENGGYTLADMCCDDQEANARRIVACVNACAGIPTEWLSSGLTGCLQNVRAERDEYKKQRDELLAALDCAKQKMDSALVCHPNAISYLMGESHEILEAAIASVKESK